MEALIPPADRHPELASQALGIQLVNFFVHVVDPAQKAPRRKLISNNVQCHCTQPGAWCSPSWTSLEFILKRENRIKRIPILFT